MFLNKQELAWAAGFFDGEGHIGFYSSSHQSRKLLVNVAQKDRRPLERFQKAVGGVGVIVKNKRGIHYWRSQNFEISQFVVGVLWKFLSEPKREQVKLSFEQFKAVKMKRSVLVFKGKPVSWSKNVA